MSGSLDADDNVLGEDPKFGKQPFVSAKSLAVGVRLWPLIAHQQLRVTSLTLDQPSVQLIQNRAGQWNFSSFAGIHAPKDTVIKHAGATLNIAPSGIRADPAVAEITDLGSLTGKGRWPPTLRTAAPCSTIPRPGARLAAFSAAATSKAAARATTTPAYRKAVAKSQPMERLQCF